MGLALANQAIGVAQAGLAGYGASQQLGLVVATLADARRGRRDWHDQPMATLRR